MSSTPRFVRSFVAAQLLAIRFYRKGKHAIDPLLASIDPALVTAMEDIDRAYVALGLLNPPGPR